MIRRNVVMVSLFLVGSAGRLIAQGSGVGDPPITAMSLDAIAIKRAVSAESLKKLMVHQTDSAGVVTFITNPLGMANDRGNIPDQARLKALQVSVAKNQLPDTAKKSKVQPLGESYTSGLSGAIIYGTTDFIIARAKDELVGVAMDQAKDWFDQQALLRRAFPNSYIAIKERNDAGLDAMIQVLRTSGRKDLAALPEFVRDTVRAACLHPPTRTECSLKRKTSVDGLVIATTLLENIEQGSSPLAALATLGTNDLQRNQLLTERAKVVVHIAGVAARECPNADCSRLKPVLDDGTGREYATILIAREVVPSGINLPVDTAKLAADVSQIRATFVDILAMSADLQGPTPGTPESRTERIVRFAAVLDGASTLTEDGIALAKDFDHVPSEEFEQFSDALKHCADLARAVSRQDYVAVSVHALAVAQDADFPIPGQVLRWASFGASIAAANSASDVQTALNNFALPNGSFAAKRLPVAGESDHIGVYVNSYLGVNGGYETVRTSAHPTAKFGGTALPIGLELAYADSDKAFSVFAAIVDFGAVASYRVSHADASSLPNVGFAQVIAPGIFLTFSPVRRYPFAMGFGYQYAPRLRSLTTGTTVDAVRFAALLSFDVPLFRLH